MYKFKCLFCPGPRIRLQPGGLFHESFIC